MSPSPLLFVVPAVRDPAQRQLLGDDFELRRVVGYQYPDHGEFHKAMIGGDRSGIQDVGALLRTQLRKELIEQAK